MTTTFETARIGDKVWSLWSGWGEVIEIERSESYPIYVSFPNGEYESFTLDGLFSEDDIQQTLFWDEVKIVAPQKPLPDLEVDAKVLVWTDPLKKHRRHFSHFNGDRINTFDSGATSFSKLHRNSITSWPYWELAE